MNQYIERVLAETKAKNANEPEFLQTVEEVLSSLEPVIAAQPEYEKAALLERMVEPERVIESLGRTTTMFGTSTAATAFSTTRPSAPIREASALILP